VKPLLDIDGLARLLNRGSSTILRDIRRNPEAVPPMIKLPGTRLLRWREIDVEAWLDIYAAKRNPLDESNS